MQAEIITIGDEILVGQIVDSNSAFICKELNKIGVSVYQSTSIQDNRDHILETLKIAGERSSVVIITGGLGPTKDDITKHTLCQFFGDHLVQDNTVLEHIEELLKKYIPAPISGLNRKQALVPSKASVLHNANGTAPGLWMKKADTAYIALPGVPFEMKHLIREKVIPKIVEEYERPYIFHRTLLTYGMGESTLADKIEDWENDLPDFIKLAYLPNMEQVRLRLTAKGSNEKCINDAVEEEVQKLYGLIGDIIYGEGEQESIEEQVAKLFTQKGMTLSTAESFTGGKIAGQITAIPGASTYYKGSIVSYATEAKIKVLDVKENLVKEHSVVSKEVAMAMAKNVKEKLGTDFSVATTGNAGPTKGDSDEKVGTVFIAISTPKQTFAQRFVTGNRREHIVQRSVNKAFGLLLKEILNF